MTEAERLADANIAESVREHARWQAPCELVEEGGMQLLAGPNALPITFRNCAMRLEPALATGDALASAERFFAGRKRGYSLLLRASQDADLDEALRGRGIAPVGEVPCMLVDEPVPVAVPEGVRVERFESEDRVRDAAQVLAEAYEAIKLPAVETQVFFSRPGRLLSERVVGFVAYRDGVPASTALTILSGRGAGVYWVGTAPAAQRAGLGELCTRLATNAGFEAGASMVTLQATPFGEPVYARIGYRTYDRLVRYRFSAPA